MQCTWDMVSRGRNHTCARSKTPSNVISGAIVRISPDEVSVIDLDSQKTIHRIGSPFLKSDWYVFPTSHVLKDRILLIQAL